MGRPIISTDVPGCRDAVVPNETGYLVPAKDVTALADAMVKICDASDERLAAMGKLARADAEARFSDAQLVDATIALVEPAT